MTQRVDRLPTNRITVISGKRLVPVPPAHRTPKRSSSSGCVTSRGNCCFSRLFLDRPPGWGARLAGGVVHSRAVATVARWQQPGRANGEEWAPHAKNGLGDDETPGSQPSGRSPRQRAKLEPAPPERGGKMLVECGPGQGRPLPEHEAQGRTWANDCPGPAILPAPAADHTVGARIKGPTILSQPPPAAQRKSPKTHKNPLLSSQEGRNAAPGEAPGPTWRRRGCRGRGWGPAPGR